MSKLLDLFNGRTAVDVILFLKFNQTLLVRPIESGKEQPLLALIFPADRHHTNVVLMLVNVGPREFYVGPSKLSKLCAYASVSLHVENVPRDAWFRNASKLGRQFYIEITRHAGGRHFRRHVDDIVNKPSSVGEFYSRSHSSLSSQNCPRLRRTISAECGIFDQLLQDE